MKPYSRNLAPDLIRKLEDAGVITEDPAITHPTSPGLQICQVGGVVESSAFDLDGGHGTGFMLALHVAVALPTFRIWGWRLDLPWEELQIQWLMDPREQVPPDEMYQVPGRAGLRIPRDEVINHHRLLRPGYSLDGWLIGWGFESIPDTYGHAEIIKASLVLVDEMGRDFPTPVELWADRWAKINRQKRKKSTRPGLFEKPENAKTVLIKR